MFPTATAMPKNESINSGSSLGRHAGEGRYPAKKNTPRSGQKQGVAPLAWEIINHLDTACAGMTAFGSNG